MITEPRQQAFRWLALGGVAMYAAAAEIDVGRLVGSSADSLVDYGLAAVAILGAAAMWRLHGADTAGFLAAPLGWLVVLLLAGLTMTPLSLAPVSTAQRSVVALALVASAAIVVDRYGFRAVIAAVAVGSTVVVVGSVAFELLGSGTQPNQLSGTLDTGFAGFDRHQGITSQPNQLGRVAATALVTGALLVRWIPYRTLGWLAQLAGLLGLAFAQSRTAIIVGLLLLLVAHARSGRPLLVGVAALIALSAGLWLAAAGSIDVQTVTREGAGSTELTTVTGRTDLWRITLDLARDRPLAGHGAFATDRALAPAVEDGRIGFEATDAHNGVLNVLLAQGVLGLVLLGAFVATSVASVVNGRATPGAGIVIAMVAALALTENLFWKPNSTLLLLAVATAAISRSDMPERCPSVVRAV